MTSGLHFSDLIGYAILLAMLSFFWKVTWYIIVNYKLKVNFISSTCYIITFIQRSNIIM